MQGKIDMSTSTEKKNKSKFPLIEIAFLAIIGVVLFQFFGTGKSEEKVFAVMDRESIIEVRLAKKDTPLEALVYLKTLVKVYKQKGVVVMDKATMITYPESMEAVLPEKAALFAMAKELGLEVTKKTYDDAQVELDKQYEQIMNAIYNK